MIKYHLLTSITSHSHPDMYTMFQVCDHFYLQPCPGRGTPPQNVLVSLISALLKALVVRHTLSLSCELNLWGGFLVSHTNSVLALPQLYSFLSACQDTPDTSTSLSANYLFRATLAESAPSLMAFAQKINPMNWESTTINYFLLIHSFIPGFLIRCHQLGRQEVMGSLLWGYLLPCWQSPPQHCSLQETTSSKQEWATQVSEAWGRRVSPVNHLPCGFPATVPSQVLGSAPDIFIQGLGMALD